MAASSGVHGHLGCMMCSLWQNETLFASKNEVVSISAMMDVELLAHRGLWNDASEKNQRRALRCALDSGFGLETDLRDFQGQVVIAHDCPIADHNEKITLDDLCQLYRKSASHACLALNIKADGLADIVHSTLLKHKIDNYFVFDMSVPDLLAHLRQSQHCFTRQSEYESVPSLLQRCEGVWLDAFESRWYGEEVIEAHLCSGKSVCIVSSELHGRSAHEVWPLVRRVAKRNLHDARLLLCTDNPNEFKGFMNDQD
ncbi:hypothetical protein [Novipirellula galeiformis]|nr:hypothetical protein [Novipirellula galeiformis]